MEKAQKNRDTAAICTGAGPACLLMLSAALSGCGRHEPVPPQTVLARQCSSVSGARDLSLNIVPSSAGQLVVSIEQRGISVIGTLREAPGKAATPATSATERIGIITLTHSANAMRPVTLRISSQDPKNITGEVCTSAVLVRPTDALRIQADQAFADAGKAVYRRQWRDAFDDYLQASRLYERLQLKPQITATRHSMAEVAYSHLFREHDAYAIVTETISNLESDDPVERGLLDNLLARALMDQPELNGMNRTMRARELFNRSHELLAAFPFAQRELPRIDMFQGFIDYLDDKQSEATKLWTQAAETCSRLGDWQCYAQARQNNAAIAEEQKDYAFAMSVYEDALHALKLVPTPDLTADVADNLGRLQARIGLFGPSEQSRKTAMQIYAQVGNCAGARRSAASLGMLLMAVGSIGDASAYLDQAVSARCPELLGAISEPTGVLRNVSVESDLPANSRFDGSTATEISQKHCLESINLDTETVDEKLAVFDAFVSLSNALLTASDFASANRCMTLAAPYAATPRAKVRLAYMTGMVNLRQRLSLPASRAFSDALDVADKAGLPDTYIYRGFAHLGLAQSALLAGRPEIASREAFHELRMSSMRADVGQIVASLQLLAGSYRVSGETNKAIQTLRLAVRLIERVPIAELDGEKRATYLATQHAVYSELTELLVQNAHTQESAAWDAFAVSELGRARSLRYAANQAAADGSATKEDVSQDFGALLDRVKVLAESAKEPGPLVDAMASTELESQTAPEPFDAPKIVKTLERLDSTLVEYTAGEQDMYAFVIDRGRIHVVRLGGVEAIARAAAKLNDRLRAPEPVPSHIRAAAQDLARLVIWPISSLVTTDRIIFVPDDALHTIPFAVLPWSEADRNKLVVHRAETALLASAFLLSKYEGQPANTGNRFTLIGDPVFRSADWRRECRAVEGQTADSATAGHSLQAAQRNPRSGPVRSVSDWAESLRRLPGTRTEVLAIAQLVQDSRPSSSVRTLIRCAATPSALKDAAGAEGALLHIATHGRIDSHRPRLSALALTPDASAQGNAAFSLLDILNLRLHSRLVVLSACDTSRGRLLPGEGVLGLAQAFLQAGASSVVASFWRVEDQATADFMKKFYDHLISDRLPASAALRRAQLDQASTDGTYSWAAFSLYGAPDTAL